MFDFAWSEIALIAAVALIAIGPKDMPAAIRGITNMIKKARRMAAEFQTHVDEMVRDANLDEVRNQFNEIRNFDVKGHIERAVDSDGSLRSTFATNPLEPTIPAGASPIMKEVDVSDLQFESPAEAPAVADAGVGPEPSPVPVAERAVEIAIEAGPASGLSQIPAFIPPNMTPPPGSCTAKHPTRQTAVEPEPPAFIPPEVVLQRRSRPSA
jgi:sec-independent protein translocase protein TatB